MPRLVSTICAVVLAALPIRAADDRTAICDGIASRLRANSDLVAGTSSDDPLSALSSGPAPYVEVTRQPVLEADSRDDAERMRFIDRFRSAFSPSEGLGNAVMASAEFRLNEVFALPQSNLHLVVNTGGPVSCRTFVFFERGTGKPAELAPAVTTTGDPVCYNATGHLARVAGVEAYVESVSSLTHYRYALRVVPWQAGKWADGCSIAADFRSTYRVSQAFARPDGPISAAAIRDLAPRLVEQWADAADPDTFRFGPAWPEFLNSRARELQRLGAALGTMPVPTFGAPQRSLGPFYQALEDPDAFPMLVDGQLYLAQIGHATIGWRVFQDAIVILYGLKDGRLLPVASAVVEQDQGALVSVRVGPISG